MQTTSGSWTHKFLRFFNLGLVLGAVSLCAACGSDKKIGEACTDLGKTGECESGAVCSKNTSSAVVCLKICSAQTDCSGAEDCNGVEGSSVKACRTKVDSTTGTKK